MVVEAVIAMDEKQGSSLQSIRKYIASHYDVNKQQTASFNSLTLKGASKAVANGELEKLKNSFRISAEEKQKRKDKEKKAYKLAKEMIKGDYGKGTSKASNSVRNHSLKCKHDNTHHTHCLDFTQAGLHPGSSSRKSDARTSGASEREHIDAMFVGTAAESNKVLRKQLLDARAKRDAHLLENFKLLDPFMPMKVSGSPPGRHSWW